MKMTQKPRSIRPTRPPMTMKELQTAVSHVMRVLLHQASLRTLSQDEYSYHCDAVQAALAGWKPEPYASMDDRELPDDDGPVSLPSQRQGGNEA